MMHLLQPGFIRRPYNAVKDGQVAIALSLSPDGFIIAGATESASAPMILRELPPRRAQTADAEFAPPSLRRIFSPLLPAFDATPVSLLRRAAPCLILFSPYTLTHAKMTAGCGARY